MTSISASSADVPTKDDSGSVEPEKLEESFVTADPNTEHVAESDSAAEVSPQETGEAQELAGMLCYWFR